MNAGYAAQRAITANPTTAWATNSWVQGLDPGPTGEMFWDGSAWDDGKAIYWATGATAGVPGAFTPSPCREPNDAAHMTALGVVASPTTAWTTGQYVQGMNYDVSGQAYWNGTAWVGGKAP